MTIQGPITFQDVAASFTEQQWAHLEDWQKEIYKTVVKEIHEAIISLGYTIVNPKVVFNVKKQDESIVCLDSPSVEKSPVVRDLPDILLRVKAEPPAEAARVTEIQQDDVQPSTSGSAETPEPVVTVLVQDITDDPMPSGSQPKKSIEFPIKSEEAEGYSIDDYNSTGGDKQPSPSQGDELIKHESEEETDAEEDFQDTASSAVKRESTNPAGAAPIQQVDLSAHCSTDGNSGDKQSGEESTSETEPKRFKIGPQVRGDILSLQEREARRLRVMEGNVKQIQEHPSIIVYTFIAEDVKKENGIPDMRRDIKNTKWCKCGNCCVMSTVEESICCHEISGLLSQLNEERLCVTKLPAFQELCLDRDRLDFLYRFLARIKRKNDALYYVHKLRRTSYRAFVIWAHGFLDFHKYRPVPACVVKCIQEFLPYPEELNVGYKKMYDYSAAVMALDHI